MPEECLNDLAFAVENESGCAERGVVLRALRDAARDFCVQSEAWRKRFFYAVDPDITTYDAAGAEDAYVLRILGVKLLRGTQWTSGGEIRYTLIDANTLRVDRELLKAGEYLHLESVLVPAPGSEQLPEELTIRHRDGLISGACLRIHLQAGRPWYSPERSSIHERRYREEIQRAVSERMYDRETGNPGFAG